jgi:peptidoglycan hydrolase-like protein with peptidoglycan-binding domain
VGGPQTGSGYTWWNINYDTSCDGWSVQNYLTTDLNAATMAGGPFGSAMIPLLIKGTSSPEVSRLQTFLSKAGYFSETPTGYFGSLTEQAVKAFQTKNNLAAVGIVGPKTQALLESSGW